MTDTDHDPPCPVCEDTEWMLSWGTWPEEVAHRIGHPLKDIRRHLTSHGRTDLAARLGPRERQR